MTGTLQPIYRICRECASTFTITPDEQRFLADLAARTGEDWILPWRCVTCRQARRRAQYGTPAYETDYVRLTCIDCGIEFIFSGRDAEYFARRGFDRPRRCRPCRTARSLTRSNRQRGA